MTFRCPDGHEAKRVISVKCDHEDCPYEVSYVPVAKWKEISRQLEEVVKVGDALARNLSGAPGIDVMRSGILQEWKEAAHSKS
jgi:hypothetical protein